MKISYLYYLYSFYLEQGIFFYLFKYTFVLLRRICTYLVKFILVYFLLFCLSVIIQLLMLISVWDTQHKMALKKLYQEI